MQIITTLLLVYPSIILVNGQGQKTGTKIIDKERDEFLSLQKELPDANLYRKTGHWIMRATSDKSFFLTRVQFTLRNDQVIVHEYIGQKSVYTGVQSHIKDNKVIQSVSSDGQHRKIVCFHQDDKILISLLVLSDKQVLSVLVKSSKSSHIDDNAIRNIILNSVLNKPNIRALVEGLVSQLVFVNQNLPPTNYALEDPDYGLNIAEGDLVDCDLTKSVGNWTIKAMSGDVFGHLTYADINLKGDQPVLQYSSSSNKDLTVTFNYIGNSRVIRVDIYGHKTYAFGKIALIYVDDTQFILFGKTSIDNAIGVYCRVNGTCNESYLKGVIDNLLLFTQDVKREIKDLVPKLIWRK